jgi:hypothetical protein
MALQVTNKAGHPLYAIALNVFKRGKWHAHPVEYLHAPDAVTAKNLVIRSFKERIDIIAVGPAIGFFVEDNHGEVLSAE